MKEGRALYFDPAVLKCDNGQESHLAEVNDLDDVAGEEGGDVAGFGLQSGQVLVVQPAAQPVQAEEEDGQQANYQSKLAFTKELRVRSLRKFDSDLVFLFCEDDTKWVQKTILTWYN